jgi:3-oxoacyl-ACP reductase-like protein
MVRTTGTVSKKQRLAEEAATAATAATAAAATAAAAAAVAKEAQEEAELFQWNLHRVFLHLSQVALMSAHLPL